MKKYNCNRCNNFSTDCRKSFRRNVAKQQKKQDAEKCRKMPFH